MGRGPQARIRHDPQPDPTNTFCIVADCRRYLGIGDPSQHRRGSAARVPQSAPTWVERSFHIDPNAALEERIDQQTKEIRRLREDVDRLLATLTPGTQLEVGSWRDNRPARDGTTGRIRG